MSDPNPAKLRTETMREFNERRAEETKGRGFKALAGTFTTAQLEALAERCIRNVDGEEPLFHCPDCFDTGFVVREAGPDDEFTEVVRDRKEGTEHAGPRRKVCKTYGPGTNETATVSSRCRCKDTRYGILKPRRESQHEL